MYNVQEVEVQ